MNDLIQSEENPQSAIHSPKEIRDLLRSSALEFGVRLNDRMLDDFDEFTALLLEWNAKFNLTRITDPEEIALKHYLDSLTMLKYVKVRPDALLLDVGTGGGIPGIPLKIVLPELRLTLLDSIKKKLTYLDAVVKELGLKGVETAHSRAEDLGRNKLYRGQFDVVTSRAVARMNVLCELCMPFCRIGGRFIAFKGPDARAEVKEADTAVRALGGEIEIAEEFPLPNTDQRRTLVIIRKTRATTHHYPRKAGTPEKEPIR